MSSYTSSFKALVAALAIIGLIEVGHASLDSSSPVERSSYLNWNFESVELLHKVIIYEKLANAVRDQPDVIQVGDSSGFHGIVPAIVDQYLGGLRYENLSCCANTGFDGYHAIADFALRQVPSIKAVVLYISLNNPPREASRLASDVVGGEDRLRNAFGPIAALTSPRTLSARHDVVRTVYNLGETFNQSGLLPFGELWPEFVQSLAATRGWRPEEDVHRLPDRQAQRFREFCGPTGERRIDWHRSEGSQRDVFGARHSLWEIELRRFAALTARHGAKLILLVQPYPCAALAGDYIPSLQAGVAAVAASYPNLIVPFPPLFDPWPADAFSSPDHLATGHEEAVSRRAGRLIAQALGIAHAEPPGTLRRDVLRPVTSSDELPFSGWKSQGISLQSSSQQKEVTLVETAQAGNHRLETTLPALAPGTYVASFRFRTEAARQAYFQFQSLQWPGDAGHFHCNGAAGEVMRTRSVVDATIERLPDGSVKCSATFRLTRAGTVIAIGLSTPPMTLAYQGDGTSRLALSEFELSAVDNAN